MLTFDVPSGANLETYFAQMTNGVPATCRLARGGTYSGAYTYRQAGGGGSGDKHYIEAQPGTGPLPIISGTLQLGIDATPIHGLVCRDIEFTEYGPKALGNGTDLVLRRLLLSSCRQGIVVQAGTGLTWSRVTIKKCRVLDLNTQGSGEHGNGIYCARVNGLQVLENVLDHAVAPLDIFSHHIYIQNGCTGLVIRRNLLARSSSHGIQARPGGSVDHNLLLDCQVGILGGGGTEPEAGGVFVNIHDNAVLGGDNINNDSGLAGGWAYYLENVSGGFLNRNIAADPTASSPRGITLDCSTSGFGAKVGVLGVTGTNHHRSNGTIHTDAGPMKGTVIALNQVPLTSADLDYDTLGLDWETVRSGTVDVLAKLIKIRKALGLPL